MTAEYAVRIGHTGHLSTEPAAVYARRTLCGLRVAGTPEAPVEESRCFTCMSLATEAKLEGCAACGEALSGDLAETARGIIHAECIEEGEQLA